MEITKLSTKGQIVIPESLRKDLEVGTSFIVSKKNNLIVLKIVSGLNDQEQKELKELEAIWKNIDSGNCKKMEFGSFIEEIQKW